MFTFFISASLVASMLISVVDYDLGEVPDARVDNHLIPPAPPEPGQVRSDERKSVNKEFTQRFTDNGREIAINVKGEVNVYDDASVSGDLKFDDDAELRAYLRSQEKELRIIWNASGCQVMDGAGVQECSRDQRRLIVSAIKKRPKTPTPP